MGLRPGELVDPLRLRQLLVDEVAVLLLDAPPMPKIPITSRLVTLVIGVNGSGKTTSIAKLARRSVDLGESVALVAADTFRAAAIEQLVVWGERLGVPVIRQGQGSDPAAVVFDALQAARSRNIGHLVVDTAGRLHTKKPLMDELAKIGRVVAREGGDGCVRRTLLVLDATAGHNALQQAREFKNAVPIDGIVLAKIDGTAKGGIVVSLARELRLPVAFLGDRRGSRGPGPVRCPRLRPGAGRRRPMRSAFARVAQIGSGGSVVRSSRYGTIWAALHRLQRGPTAPVVRTVPVKPNR